MADYVLIRKSRNVISSVLHVILNILLGVGSIAITVVTGSWIIGLVLVVLSKWRVFAVRSRYLYTNILSNLVDFIVGASFVIIAYCSGTTFLPIHAVLAAGYTLWLVVIKPMSSSFAAEAQSLIAVFLGSTAATMLYASSNSVFLVIACHIIGFSASRHILVQSDSDDNFGLTVITCGLLSAEIAWICSNWLIVYTFGSTGILVPQLAIILTITSFVSNRVFKNSIEHKGKIRFSEIAAPVIFSVLIVAIIVIWFSNPIFDV